MSAMHPSSSGRSDHETVSLTTKCAATHYAEPMGVLSMTLAPSPAVQWILPARIRARKHRDVVFIGGTYVQLREFHQNGQLTDTTARLELDTQILGAKVISAEVRLASRLDEILKQEYDEEQFFVKGAECPDEQPPQIVVLATASNELIYLYAKNCSSVERVKFVFAKRALLEGVSIPKTHIRYMAIDHESKIMATASWNSCSVFSLKDVDDLKTGIDNWETQNLHSFQPNIEQRMFQVDGHILKMDFLRPSTDEPDKIILLFIVAAGKSTLMLLYQWDMRHPINQIKPMEGCPRSLTPPDEFPLLLIPSRKPRSFILVTQNRVVFYDNIRADSVVCTAITLPASRTGKNDSLWAQWAKPSRHLGYNNTNEELLLVREDGQLQILSRNHDSPNDMPRSYSPGNINTGVDLAVCMLPGPRGMSGDTLIVGGSMADGGVYHLPSREALTMLQVIPNVSPIHDLAVIASTVPKQRDIKTLRCFVTAGMGQNSSLSELRFGHQAQVGWEVLLEECETVNRIWTLEHVRSKTLFIIASHPEHTTTIALDLEKQLFETMNPDIFLGLQPDVPTLSTIMLPQDISVVINSNGVTTSFESSRPFSVPLENCICADIDSIDGTFAIAYRDKVQYHIQIGLVRPDKAQIPVLLSPDGYSLSNRPLCLVMFRILNDKYLAVGYGDGNLEIISLDDEGKLTFETRLEAGQVLPSATTSIAVLTYPSLPHAMVLLGTRSGQLRVMKLIKLKLRMENGKHFRLDLERAYCIGSMPVTVVAENTGNCNDPPGALILCGSRLDRIELYENAAGLDYYIAHVWLTKLNELTYSMPNINAVHRVAALKSIDRTTPSRFLICAVKDEMMFAKCIQQEQIIPRRIQLDEHGASLMIHSKLLNKFIVASNHGIPSDHGRNGEDNSVHGPILYFVDADTSSPSYEGGLKISLGSAEEEVRVLMLWEPTDGRSHYDLIMVGLSNSRNSRLGFVSARKVLGNSKLAVLKQLMRFANKKLHAICAVDKSSLAVSAGNEIVLMRLDLATKKWHEDGRFTLPSPALSLSAQGTIIYAATERHSTVVLSWQTAIRKWDPVHTDHEAKNARIVLPFGNGGSHFLVALATVDGSDIVAYPISRNPIQKALPLFIAGIPLALQHLTPIPTSWSESRQYAFQGVTHDGTLYLFQTLTHAEWKLLSFVAHLTQPSNVTRTKKSMALLAENFARNLICSKRKEDGNIDVLGSDGKIDDKINDHKTSVLLSNPKKMHVSGDVLKRIVDQGPGYLRTLLSSVEVKTEVEAKAAAATTATATIAASAVNDDMKIDDHGPPNSNITNNNNINNNNNEVVKSPMSKLEKLAIPIVGRTDDVPAAVIAWTRKMLRATIF